MYKDDSRKIKKGDIFVANSKGIKYIEDAINNKASEIIIKDNFENYDEFILDKLNSNFKFKLIGVTGTNGKTTTCYMLYQVLNELGYKCAYIGTLGFYKKDYYEELNNTTPTLLTLYNLLLDCNECDYVVMEVSSIGLVENRLGNLKFDYAIFTNLTHDHLDYHKSIENYALAKKELFKKIKDNGISIINIDSDYKDYFLQDNSLTYGFNNSDFYIQSYNYSNNKMSFNIDYKNNIYSFSTNLIGKFNVYNLTSVISVLLLEGIEYKNISNVLINLSCPKGRMEKYKNVYVDYAHTPDAVLNVINTSKELKPNKIITILGCGGNRDKTKRHEMGTIASYNSDNCIFTSDNPRNEDQLEIINDMLLDTKDNYIIEPNRELAIKKGIELLTKNDILLILGKGHEEYQIINGVKNNFSDIKIVKKYYK